MHWLCLHFPSLPLEVFSRAQPLETPWVITEDGGERRHARVHFVNPAARAAGIRPGMTVSAADTLVPGLRVRGRDGKAEARALDSLAAWAGRFTSLVSLHPPQALLLEVGGSLRLFGGHGGLRRRITQELPALGFEAMLGSAPTPLAAVVLARAGTDAPVLERRLLPGALARYPLTTLGLAEQVQGMLEDMGIERLGELLRLPRAGLAKRFGPALTEQIGRLLGELPDPQRFWQAPTHFVQHLDLPAETADAEALAFPARRLLLELEAFLRRRDAGARTLQWTFRHERRPATRLLIGLRAPSREPAHLLMLLRERLLQTDLPVAVQTLSLEVDALEPLAQRPGRLDGTDEEAEDPQLLLERLSARLGDDSVRGVRCRADHRPERAWDCAPPDPGEAAAVSPPASSPAEKAWSARPLWLLDRPQGLETAGGRLRLPGRGFLQLLSGPERIESGWWDGSDAARDYYIARDDTHARHWIYRERRGERRWFLHGHFA